MSLSNVLAWPLRRVRQFITQRVENELRHEITLLQARMGAFEAATRVAMSATQDELRNEVTHRLDALNEHFDRVLQQQQSERALLSDRVSAFATTLESTLRDSQQRAAMLLDERIGALLQQQRTIADTFDERIAALRAQMTAELGQSGDLIEKRLLEQIFALQAGTTAALTHQREEHEQLSAQLHDHLAIIQSETMDAIDDRYAKAQSALREALTASNADAAARAGEPMHRIRALEIVAADSQAWTPASTKSHAAKPRFSIVMPVRDRATAAAAAIESVLAQTFGDWELLIVDDGSKDATAKRLKTYTADSRIRYIRREPGGACAARNSALSAARGELVAYLDSDNLWFPNFLAGMNTLFDTDATVDSAYGVLVLDAEIHSSSRFLWAPFDRAALERGNYIDINTFVHRHALIERYGMFDENLPRLGDWDLILRYTADGNCRRAAVAGARYSTRADDRISDVQTFGDNWFRIQRKMTARPVPSPAPKVLYALWHYPQLSGSYVETEIRAMRKLGIDIEVWSADDVAAPFPPSVPLHRGTLSEAIAKTDPDIVHVHWLSTALDHAETVRAAGKILSVRSHGFEASADVVSDLLKLPCLKQLVLFPSQQELVTQPDSRVMFLPSVFDTTLFAPSAKNRRMVLRTAAALPSKDLRFFFEAAKRLPEHRFVLIASTAYRCEDYVRELIKMKAELDSPAELLFDMPRERIAQFVREAAIYLHTVTGPDDAKFTPIGMPISIAEAMATGAYTIVRALPALRDYVGPAGDTYDDLDHACALIKATTTWDEKQWRDAERRAIDHAWLHHADEIVLRPLRDAWVALAQPVS